MKTKLIVKNILSAAIIFVVIVLPLISLAQSRVGGNGDFGGETDDPPSQNNQTGIIKIINPFKKDTIPALLEAVINDILIPIGTVIAVIMIIFAGFLFVTARGDVGQINKAKDTLKYAVIGSAILLAAWAISKAIQATINELKI